MIDQNYFKEYRLSLGFTNQGKFKEFLSAKDVKAGVDYNYISSLNERMKKLILKLDEVTPGILKQVDIDSFISDNLFDVYNKLKDNNILPLMNNQGRRPESVYFSWMRGYIISVYFLNHLSYLFDVNLSNIELIGDDSLLEKDTFKRTPKADIEITLNNNKKIRVEIQAGFQGVNDIKQHKIREAEKVYYEKDINTLIIHFDMFNGQVAIVRADNIEGDNINWITRTQMEGQTVFNIDQNYFVWKITEQPPKIDTLEIL
tara:strand:+ start:268 stop:1044 length:777 start_codon:yes stop_codon:yes gene_type:complete